MRLIDADKLDVVLRNEAKPFGHGVYECGITDGLALARECVETAPTIDAVPVVRCRECIHNPLNWKHDELDITDYADITCDYWMSDGLTGDDFCSQGQRREEDGDGEHQPDTRR